MLPSQFPEVEAYLDLQRVLERLVDMQFADLRDLMRLPAYTIRSGMNLTTAARLFDVVSGCSICFYNSTVPKLSQSGIAGREFKGILQNYFPWAAVPVPVTDAIDVFYVWSRNPMAHALGVDVRQGNPDIDVRKRGLRLRQVLALEDAPTLPKGIAPPLLGQPGSYALSVLGLFWGVHRMLHSLFADPQQVQAADATARHIPL
jgi:hypothetical protein